MRKLRRQIKLHLAKKAAKGQGRWCPPRSRIPRPSVTSKNTITIID